ncbi:MAG: hypothetical protein WC011_01430 [Candidatus Paceibacterota bacterium]
MKKIIHNLRKKPEEERRHILHITVFIFSVCLVLLWVYGLSSTLVNSSDISIKEDLQPLTEFTADLNDSYVEFTNSNQ